MKASLILISLALALSATAQQRGANRGFGRGRGRGRFNQAKGGKGGNQVATTKAATATAVAGGTTGAGNNNAGGGAAAGNGNGNNGNGNGNGNGGNNAGAGNGAGNNNADPQKSLTLDPRVVAKGFANDGQDVPVDGQVSSLTSTNNFINFCLTVPNLPITDGKQITTGSCNPAPIGVIPAENKMPSSKFVSPKNGDTIKANTQFTIQMAIKNLQAGNFVNAQANYFAAPQTLNRQGIIIGHTHVVIEPLTSLDQTTPTDPKKFQFFKGVNGAANAQGIVTADVAIGVPAGNYRLCSINSSSNHQPVIVPIAQHGSLDDCVYFTATANGQAAGNGAGAGNGAANNGGKGNAAGGAANNGGKGNTGAATGAGKGNTGAATGAGKGNTGATTGAGKTARPIPKKNGRGRKQ